ncbi:M1 family metallopeptidase [Psychroserpens algicola]|uniref:M1 family metallopeptidase n=1 Tax=Psychroserpens algicola TaxID=1719034 RepID=UPI00195360D8|nr:M1 family metallopeptidase [Psychroserpens algicola]
MKFIQYILLSVVFISFNISAQNAEDVTKSGHTNLSKFRQLNDEFATPNRYRTASGAPGPAYYQQQADYKIDVTINDKTAVLNGYETITYTNNSPDELSYLWVQLDQNVRTKELPRKSITTDRLIPAVSPSNFTSTYMEHEFDGGFHIEKVTTTDGKPLSFTINQTMMRIDLPKPMMSGDIFSFDIQWWYKINDHVKDGGRSGYELFPDGNRNYIIAQFYPRMAAYNDVDGWQNFQFWGSDEFALSFGNFEVNITVPSDHLLDATGRLMNREDVFTEAMMQRYETAKKSYKKPVVIATQEEAEVREKGHAKSKKTWKFLAENVRDFAFTTSRKYIWDMMAVAIGDKTVMAASLYPKEGNPLWEEWSTKVVASTLKSYSERTFDYPYHKAVSVHAIGQGMEYPMICWNYGRPEPNGKYTDYTKYRMMGVIIHEIGHNFFPMIVNSDERQWKWMDEGVNAFVQYLAEQDFVKRYPEALSEGDVAFPSRRGPATKAIRYMSGDQDRLAPIMSTGLNLYKSGSNAYVKTSSALNILRDVVMGPELFDYAFKQYANRWMFKHPTPEDFFRTMEDASAVDLDWFWRGWFYTTDWVDIGIKDVKTYYVSSKPNQYAKNYALSRNLNLEQLHWVYFHEDGSVEFDDSIREGSSADNSPYLKTFLKDNFSRKELKNLKQPKYFYSITFEKPGGLVMPIILELKYTDGTTKTEIFPAQIWRFNDKEVTKVIASEKEIESFIVDPEKRTADINISNNSWPKE